MRESMCPTYPDFPLPLVRVVSCDRCGVTTVYAGGEVPHGWLVARGVVLCTVCRKGVA